jgi:formylglycine-generating enzyme required for sulfatase activity/3',5'-cyclic AMP phosphodiesterase CpdA
MANATLTLLHLSDTQFGRHHRFGCASDEPFDTLLTRLLDDLKFLREKHGLCPQAVLLTGDLAEWGMQAEFDQVLQFATGLAEQLAIPRRHFVIIPGNHDINRKLCEAYFNTCAAEDSEPKLPYWGKWKFYTEFLRKFYGSETDDFTKDQPWTLFEMPELKLAVAGLNSTWKESHRDEDHYGWLGEAQLRWFAERLQDYQKKGWFRIAALHHNLRRGPVQDDENLRDVEDFKKYLGGLANLVLHGHTHDGKADWLDNAVPILATGSTAVKAEQRPEEIPNQYQIIQLWPDRYQRWTRCYYPKGKAWGGDNRASKNLDAWQVEEKVGFVAVQAPFPENGAPPIASAPTPAPLPAQDPEIQTYLATQEEQHKDIALAGFKTQLRVPIDLEALYVQLRAMVDSRGTSDGCFADGEEAEAKLGGKGSADIALSDAFREAQARKCRHLVILGDPGSGKTTHLKCLLLACLRQGPESLGLATGGLPVFLPLRDLGDIQQGIPAFIEKTLDSPHLNMPQGFGRRLLQQGRLLLLFDGLDEISDAQHRAKVAHWIEQAADAWPKCTAVVTCRFAGYDKNSRLPAKFLELHLRPMRPEQSEAFIRNWYKAVETGLNPGVSGAILAAEKANALIERLRGPDFRSARMATMTRNPLLLTNLCLVHRDRGGILPKGRHHLYEGCIEVLLERWREAKLRKDGTNLGLSIPAETARKALQPLALWLHGEEGRTRARALEIAPILEPALQAAGWEGGDAQKVLQTRRDEGGVLTGWSHAQYGFMHLGFQEYLAAREISRLAIAEAFAGQPQTLPQLAKHYGESWWQEVILLLLAQTEHPLFKPFMAEALQQPRFAEEQAFLALLLEEAAEKSAEPFLDLLRQAPGTDPALWQNQLAALRILQNLAPETLPSLRAELSSHPLPELRGWAGETATGHLPGLIFTAYAVPTPPTRRSIKGEVELIYIPGGRFQMGSAQGQGDDDEHPAHTVDIQPFYLGRYPVTNAEYARYLKDNPKAKEPGYWADRRFNQAQQPVVGVDWEEACRYVQWAGGRLPSEAEWEYAARAGTTTLYFWGDEQAEADSYAWHGGNSQGATHPVGEKQPNGFGLYDMVGNVWEWVQDHWHDNYQGAHKDGSAWEAGNGGRRVIRGGSWYGGTGNLRPADRDGGTPGYRDDDLGFRLAQDP